MPSSNLRELLDAIDPSMLDYPDWLNVGLALHHEGGTVWQWDAWSQRDSKRHKPGECAKKWAGFHGSANPVTAGSLVEMAKRFGYRPPAREGRIYGWDDVIPADELHIIDAQSVEETEVHELGVPPWKQLQMYLGALFSAEEHVGYVCEAWQQEARWLPKKGTWHQTAGELCAALDRLKDIGAALADWNPEAGAWIRINPLDGQGVRDDNVTAFRFALIESDTLPIEKQAAVYAELELPIAALVHSGSKSLHAIVRIGATTREEYRERVNFLHKVCQQNGLEVDTANKNPSRLSRMPGVTRNGVTQALVGLSQGRESFESWRDWVEELNDNLPDIEPLYSIWANLPPLAPPLIDGILRQGHKMLLAGPSKAGKSFLLLQLVMAIAEGKDWLGWPCTRGRVLYINLELDRPSCLHRLRHLYEAKGWPDDNLGNIEIWHLRGKAVPMDKLAPKLIRRAAKRDYVAVVIDPIYKVITGNENEADEMAHFCNQFDRVCSELGSAVIYCHHHSKGAQGQKAARDRSSGSGVFARDPDAILDFIELGVTDGCRLALENAMACQLIAEAMEQQHGEDWLEAQKGRISQDDATVAAKLWPAARELLYGEVRAQVEAELATMAAARAHMSGWRVEGTLREFPPFPPLSLWFRHPVHQLDSAGLLVDAKAEGEEYTHKYTREEKIAKRKDAASDRRQALEAAYAILAFDGTGVTTARLAEHMGCTDRTVRNRIQEHGEFGYEEGLVIWKKV